MKFLQLNIILFWLIQQKIIHLSISSTLLFGTCLKVLSERDYFQLCQVMMIQERESLIYWLKHYSILNLTPKYLSESTNDAPNYYGQYVGLQNKIAHVADQNVHTW